MWARAVIFFFFSLKKDPSGLVSCFFKQIYLFMWYSKEYDPIQAGSIDGHGTVPHDNAIKRAMNTHCKYNLI